MLTRLSLCYQTTFRSGQRSSSRSSRTRGCRATRHTLRGGPHELGRPPGPAVLHHSQRCAPQLNSRRRCDAPNAPRRTVAQCPCSAGPLLVLHVMQRVVAAVRLCVRVPQAGNLKARLCCFGLCVARRRSHVLPCLALVPGGCQGLVHLLLHRATPPHRRAMGVIAVRGTLRLRQFCTD